MLGFQIIEPQRDPISGLLVAVVRCMATRRDLGKGRHRTWLPAGFGEESGAKFLEAAFPTLDVTERGHRRKWIEGELNEEDGESESGYWRTIFESDRIFAERLGVFLDAWRADRKELAPDFRLHVPGSRIAYPVSLDRRRRRGIRRRGIEYIEFSEFYLPKVYSEREILSWMGT